MIWNIWPFDMELCSLSFSFVICYKNEFLVRKKIFHKLPFYYTYIEKPNLKNIDLLSKVPFSKKLNVVKTDKSFRRYTMTYKVE